MSRGDLLFIAAMAVGLGFLVYLRVGPPHPPRPKHQRPQDT